MYKTKMEGDTTDINSTETLTMYIYHMFVLVRFSYDIGMSVLTHVNHFKP